MTAKPVWHDVAGEGPTVVMLHPGGTDSRSMEPLLAGFVDYRRVVIDRPGHGRSADTEGPWHFSDMADDVGGVLRELGISAAHVVGWSDGAIVGLHLALRHPELVGSLVFGGGVFHRSGWVDGVLDGEPPDFMAEAYAELSPDGAAHWPVVVEKALALHRSEPALNTADLRTVQCAVLVIVGDDDEVRLDHAVSMYDALDDGELAVLPRATHGAIVEKPELMAAMIRDFHRTPRLGGVAPIRRRDG